MDNDLDTHSQPSENLMKIISFITDNPQDPGLNYNMNRLPQHQYNQMQQQHHMSQQRQMHQPIKVENSYSHMGPIPQISQQIPQMSQQIPQISQQIPQISQQIPQMSQQIPQMSQMSQQMSQMPQQMGMSNGQMNNNNMYYHNQHQPQQPQQPQPQQQQQMYYQQNQVNYAPQSPVPSSPLPQHSSMHMPSPSAPPASPGLEQQQFSMQSNLNILNDFNTLNTPALLKKIYQLQRTQKDDLTKIRQLQKQVMCNPQKSMFDVLDAQHRHLKECIDTEVKALQRLYTQVILLPAEIHKLLLLVEELKIQQTQLELYHQELHQLAQSGPPRCIATLVVSQEPFPMVITKGKQLDDDPVVVQLLSGANVEFQSFSQMKVVMIWDNHQSKGSTQKNIESDTQTVDAFNRVAKWHLKFLNGTRKNAVTLRFGMQVHVSQPGGPVTVTVESHSTRPFIVITNECQWEESEGILLKKDSFGEQGEIPWPQFANVLQRHFLRATRQDAVSPTRSLCITDFEYIHMKFFNSQPMITPKAYNSFWCWFGKTIKKLRYQRHILPLWQLGFIHGLLSREAVHEVLKDQDPGTFLVRFSERHAGEFAVAYRIDGAQSGDCVRHYLVQPDDTSGNKKTLPDFLSEQTPFCYLLQIGIENENGVKVYHKFKKENILETYVSKRNSLPPAVGYDSNIVAYQSPMVDMDKELIDAE